jgi:DNA repair exonuclease SbcCD nuclease subunit
MQEVIKGNLLIFGDLHLSCVYSGSHKDYTYESYLLMDNIIEKVKQEKADCVIFLGDLIGVSERNIKDHQFLMRVLLFFRTLNELTDGQVYSVKGNHDKGDFSDFDLLVGFGLLKTPDRLDYYGTSHEIRFHLVDYGDEKKELEYAEVSNVVLAHNDFTVEGFSDWYQHRNGVSLQGLKNWSEVDLVIAGHLHTPSEGVINAMIGAKSVGLLYTGSPSRTSERFDDCFYVKFDYTEEDDTTNYDIFMMGLPPWKDVFYVDEEVEVEDVVSEERREASESLTEIVKEIMSGRITKGDLISQVEVVPYATDEVKQLAVSYLRKAIDGGE